MDQPRFPDGAQSGNGIRQRALLILALFLFDLLVVEHGWAGTFVRLARCMACWVAKVSFRCGHRSAEM